MAWLTSRIDRRKLLVTALLVYVIGHASSALVADFDLLLGLRLLTLMGAAIFGAQSVATVSLLVPPEQRAAAITFVFIGWSAAAAAAVPLSSWLGAVAGWEAAFWFVAIGSGVALFLVAFAIPSGLRIPPVSLKTWIDVARDPVLTVILLVTVLMMTGGFTYYTFMAADVDRRLDPPPALIASLLACFGVAGVIGTIVTSRAAASMPPGRLLLVALGLTASGLLVLALANTAFASEFGCPCCQSCGGACVLKAEQVEEDETCYDVECKEVCIPAVRFPWDSYRTPKCGRVRVIARLKEDTRKTTSC